MISLASLTSPASLSSLVYLSGNLVLNSQDSQDSLDSLDFSLSSPQNSFYFQAAF
jgi:hypothetical protein